jgi:hypothetical protein
MSQVNSAAADPSYLCPTALERTNEAAAKRSSLTQP